MSSTDPNLGLTYDWAIGANVKTDMDANLKKLGAIVQLSVLAIANDPPGSPANGDRYIVGVGTGDWAGKDDQVAVRIAGAWEYYEPDEGWSAYNADTSTYWKFHTSWVEIGPALLGLEAGKAQQVDQTEASTPTATTVALGVATLRHLLTGTVTVTGFTGTAGVTYYCRAEGAFLLTHGAGLIITQTGANITTAAGDTFDVIMITGSTCRVVNYVPVSGVVNGQIKFPATQIASADANTLDDYEEGTWTPVYTASVSGEATMATQIGEYTKIGNTVHVKGTISGARNTLSGVVRVSGLPFVSSAEDGAVTIGSAARFATDMPNMVARTISSQSYFQFRKNARNSVAENVTEADLSATAGHNQFTFSATYFSN